MIPQKNEATSFDQDAQVLLNIQSELQNMGKSLQCPLCLSTLNDPVMSPCFHAFCRTCILRSLQGHEEFRSKCPVCKDKCTKRGLVSSDHLADLAKGYKLALRAFGFAPIVYSKGVAMTQLEEDDIDDTNAMNIDETYQEVSDAKRNTNLKSCDEDNVQATKIKAKSGPSLICCHEHLEVSRAVHTVLLNAVSKIPDAVTSDNNALKPNTSNKSISWSRSQHEIKLQSLLRDQEKIIEVDQQALVRAAVTKSKMNSGLASIISASSIDKLDACSHSSKTEIRVHGNQHDSNSKEHVKASASSIPALHENELGEFHCGNHSSNQSLAISISQNDPTKQLEKHPKISTQDLYEALAEELREKEVVDRSAEMLLESARCDMKPTNSNDENWIAALDETISRCSSNEEFDVDETTDLAYDSTTSHQPAKSEKFTIGSLVQVQSRTGPGINKPGGLARVTAVHEDLYSAITYDVSYVLGGKERSVEAIYVSAMSAETTSKNRRNDKENIQDVKLKLPSSEANSSKEHTSKRIRISRDSSFTIQKYLDLAIDCYELRLKEHKNCINVVTSGLNETDLATVKVLCAEMTERHVIMNVSDSFHPKSTTLCISSLDKRTETIDNVANLRTLKLMRAALSGVPIMTMSWVSTCLERKEIPSLEFNHIVHTLRSKNDELMIVKDSMDSPSARFGVVRLGSKSHNSKKTKNFMDKHLVLMCGQFKSPGYPKKVDIQLLLKESGAVVSSSPSDFIKAMKNEIKKQQPNHFGNPGIAFIILCDDSSSDSTSGIPKEMKTVLESAIADGDKLSFIIVTSYWLFDCISCGAILSCDKYEPLSPLGKTLWRKSMNE